MVEGRFLLKTSNAEEVKRLAKICSVCLVVVSDILIATLYAIREVHKLIEIKIGLTYDSSVGYQVCQNCDEFVVFSRVSELEDIEVDLINFF